MRNELVLLCSMVAAVPGIASTVNIRTTDVRMMSPAKVHDACKGVVDTACTTFRDAELSCACEFTHGRWSMSVGISANPSTYASSPRYLPHELEHILDFNMAMRKHAENLEDLAFATQTACEASATRAEDGFRDVLRDYLRSSTWLRDHK